MLKKAYLLFLLFVFIFSVSGCGTICGAGRGAAEGFKEDLAYLNREDGWVKKSDNWIKENLW